MQSFESSLNFIFGFAASDAIDPLNNPYVDFVPYKLSTGEVLNGDSGFGIGRCT